MAQNIREEIHRLHRSKQLTFSTAATHAFSSPSPSTSEKMQDSDNSGSEMGSDSPRRPDTPPSRRCADKELFSFKQVSDENVMWWKNVVYYIYFDCSRVACLLGSVLVRYIY